LEAKRLGKEKARVVAKLIADGAIVGWFSGGAEYGPRALGNRSILCDARQPGMKDILNSRVKHREMWRPFAASVLSDHVSEHFDLDIESPFMLVAAPVREHKQKEIPSVTHVDGTCRIQSVTRDANPAYRELIEEFYLQTGCPLVLNTSFNLGGEPIVESPRDAIDSFLRTNMDYLVLENMLVSKSGTRANG
jgi:carbamoyltransferase